ncbi:hypothetical protein MnTg02_00006 [bacterium MnTg02]|nr:hypothetical protein MnTg02_00006 [bacterium MnTg02]
MALIAVGCRPGCACRNKAARPATCGDDIEVPPIVSGPVPLPTNVEVIALPGPVTSGLNVEPPCPGPCEEKPEIVSPKTVAATMDSSSVAEIDAPPPNAAARSKPANAVVITPGIVIGKPEAPTPPMTMGAMRSALVPSL